MSFNLVDSEWIPVVRRDGTHAELGLRELFEQAHQLRRVLGETASMTMALHRMLLAFAHRVYGPPGHIAWGRLWETERLPTGSESPLERYVKDHGAAFELLDSATPFLQCPGIAATPARTAAALVPHLASGNNRTLFDHTTDADTVALTPAEAARWLVTLHTYDPGGNKTPYRSDKSSVVAPANRGAMVLVEGSTLKETLLLNLLPYCPEDEAPRNTLVGDRPAWEAAPPDPTPDVRVPLGWTDLLTWPARRVWLHAGIVGGALRVDRVVIAPGTRLDVSEPDDEWMTGYERTRTGKSDSPYTPWRSVRLEHRRGVWRHSRELLLSPDAKQGEPIWQRPLALEHVADMSFHRYVPGDAVYTLRVVDQELDGNRSVIRSVLEETVAAPVTLLRADHLIAGPVIGYAVTLADRVGTALVAMERDFFKTFHTAVRPRELGRFSPQLDLYFWPRLREPFDQFLVDLGFILTAGRSAEPVARAWSARVKAIADQAALHWSEGTPRRGRQLEAVGEHHLRFLRKLHRLINEYHAGIAAHIAQESR